MKYPKTLWAIIKDTFLKMQHGEIHLVAGALAFSTVLSLIPFLGITLMAFQRIGGLEFLYPKVQQFFLEYFKNTSGAEASLFVKKIFDRLQSRTINTGVILGLLYTSWRLLNNVEVGIQKIWKEKGSRSIYKRFFISWTMMIVFPIVLALYFAARSVDFVEPLMQSHYLGSDFVIYVLILFFTFKILPEGHVHKRAAFVGSFFSSVGILILQNTFAFLTKKAFYASKLYGSLASIPLLLFWILFMWYIVLFGVAVSAGYQKNLVDRKV